MPTRNAMFTGRGGQLAGIREALLSGKPVAVQALHGMAGIGKTQVAIEYAHRFAEDYEIVWWLDSENAPLLTRQYTDLAIALGCAEPGTPPGAARHAVRSELHRRSRWLLVFDNAGTPGSIRSWLPSGPGHVIITSRSDVWAELAILVSLGVLARDESVKLLRTWVPDLAERDAATLAAALGDLPLAIAQAGSYLAATQMPASEYVFLLKGRAAELLREGRPVSYGSTSTAVTTLAYDRLRAADAGAAGLAAICAFLAPDPVPVAWFDAIAGSLPDGLATRLADPLERGKLVTTLTDSSLARLDRGLSVHRVTQAILRAHVDTPDAFRALAEDIIVASRPEDEGDVPATWPAWTRILPHLLALAPAQSGNLAVLAAAKDAAWYLAASGNGSDALDLATLLHEQCRDRLGPDHEQTLKAANAHLAALRALGRSSEARELAEDILRRRRRVLGVDHADTLRSANNLAALLGDLNDRKAARALDEDTLKRRRRVLGDDHPDTLLSASCLANDLGVLGKLAAARALYEDTLERCRRVLSDDHPNTLHTATNFAVALEKLGEHQEARALLEDTLERRRRILGHDHPDTLHTATSLAANLRLPGEHQAARAWEDDTRRRRYRELGEMPNAIQPYTRYVRRKGLHVFAVPVLRAVRRLFTRRRRR